MIVKIVMTVFLGLGAVITYAQDSGLSYSFNTLYCGDRGLELESGKSIVSMPFSKCPGIDYENSFELFNTDYNTIGTSLGSLPWYSYRPGICTTKIRSEFLNFLEADASLLSYAKSQSNSFNNKALVVFDFSKLESIYNGLYKAALSYNQESGAQKFYSLGFRVENFEAYMNLLAQKIEDKVSFLETNCVAVGEQSDQQDVELTDSEQLQSNVLSFFDSFEQELAQNSLINKLDRAAYNYEQVTSEFMTEFMNNFSKKQSYRMFHTKEYFCDASIKGIDFSIEESILTGLPNNTPIKYLETFKVDLALDLSLSDGDQKYIEFDHLTENSLNLYHSYQEIHPWLKSDNAKNDTLANHFSNPGLAPPVESHCSGDFGGIVTRQKISDKVEEYKSSFIILNAFNFPTSVEGVEIF